MDEKIARTIAGLSSWKELQEFTKNAAARGRLDAELRAALNGRAGELGRALVASRTGLDLTGLTVAEEKIVLAVSQYVAIKVLQSSNANRTFDQLRNHGLLGAAESAVSRANPTEGYRALAEANHRDISYEQIVVDHPDEFSPRAIWFSRRTLGLPNASPVPPAHESAETHSRTVAFIEWLKSAAGDNDGLIPTFTNEEAAAAIGLNDMQKYGRVHGNLLSRLDFACYRAGLPPLGLIAHKPFDRAWSKGSRSWAFPIERMQLAAQQRIWSESDFNLILGEAMQLPGQAHGVWKNELANDEKAIRSWVNSFTSDDSSKTVIEHLKEKRNAIWSRDELILALDLYMQHRGSPPAKESPQVAELSAVLNQLGAVLGQQGSGTYRNENGVYMKLMNFRRFDTEYTSDGKTGLKRGNADEAVVWDQFAGQLEHLREIARFIRQGIAEHISQMDLSGPDEFGIEEAEEGKVATRIHRYRERDRRLVAEAKARAIKAHGRLFCAACGFDFSEKYGEIGENLIDVHHTKPVHTMEPGEKTKVVDLCLLCSNCHRVVHSRRKWLTVEQVKAALAC